MIRFRPLIILLTGAALANSLIAADEDGAPLPGHSLHGESFNEGPRQFAYLMEGMGKVDFPVTTANEAAQTFFNQGVAQLHGFWYLEAERSFRQVRHLDPTCIMAYWGLAMANVNNDKRAKEFIEEAKDLLESSKLKDHEKRYLKALYQFYHGGEKDNQKRHRQLLREYERIALDFPDDIEARAFAAYQIWANSRKGNPISSHLATDALIRQVLEKEPMHPVHHYQIHLWDYENADIALTSAARCGQAAPGIAHMWHMPGHIYSKTHRYHDAVFQQEASARVDHAHMMRDRVMPHRIHNYAHNNGWCVENLAFIGQIEDAKALALNLIELPRPAKFKKLGDKEFYDAGRTSFREGRKRLWTLLNDFALWEDLLQLTETKALMPTDDPLMQAEWHWHRGVAHAYLEHFEAVQTEVEALETMLTDLKSQQDTAGDQAESKAKEEEKKEDDIKKAKKDARRPYDSYVKAAESYIGQLKAHVAVRKERPQEARKKLEEAKGLNAINRARLYGELANWEKAEEILKREVDRKRNPIVIKSAYIQVLNQLGRKDEMKKAFESLRHLAATADLDTPPITSLADIAKDLELPEDWRIARKESEDLIDRPNLDDLGPFRWQPTEAPDWELPKTDGTPLALSHYSNKPVLVIFYLGKQCVHCMEQLNAFAPQAPAYAEAGIEIVAVSTDTLDGLKETFKEGTEPFPFPLLSDHEHAIFKAYRAYDEFEEAPLHGTFLIDGDGLVRWQDVSFEPFMHAEWLLTECQRLLGMDSVTEPIAQFLP